MLRVGDPAWTDATIPDVARVVVLRLARRFWDNPEGLSYEAIGDHTVSRTAANTFLTPDERALLLDAAGYPQGVYSVGTPGVWS